MHAKKWKSLKFLSVSFNNKIIITWTKAIRAKQAKNSWRVSWPGKVQLTNDQIFPKIERGKPDPTIRL